MIKLIATDLDGTFLTSDKQLIQENIEAVQAAMEKGIAFTICTGRTLPGVRMFLDEMVGDYKTPYMILQNGAVLYQIEGEKKLWYEYQSIESRRDLIDYFFQSRLDGLQLAGFDDEHFYLVGDEKPSELTLMDAKILDQEVLPISIDAFLDKEDIIKMVVIGAKPLLDHWGQQVPEDLSKDFDLVRSQPYIIEFLNKGISKARGLEELCQLLKIGPEDVMAIGDEENDREMLIWAGHSVAMENASDSLKSLAKYKTKSNNEAGVAHIIKELVLKES